MQSLIEAFPHPVTTTMVQTATAALSWAKDFVLLLPVNAGLI